MPENDELFDVEGLCRYIPGTTPAVVYTWNHKGTGPRRIRVGKKVFYRRSDVDAWLDACAVDDPAPTGRAAVATGGAA